MSQKNLLKRAAKVLHALEWALLILLIGYSILIIIPFSDMYQFNKDIHKAKRECIYFDADAKFQPYFGTSVRLDGVVYNQKELLVYMSGKAFGPNSKLPARIQVKTDKGTVLQSSGGGSSTNILRARGIYDFKDVPAGIQSITVYNEAYSESFSFEIDLKGGDMK